ncbi:response regulator [Cohnella endophytica]|nr:response regulator [Cohnella endophytica]
MQAILVDDENLALKDLSRQLEKIGGIEVVATFNYASEALEAIESLKPDIVFLDIEMPGMSGIEAAEKLHGFDCDPFIIFVTAYEEYAVKAFELAALDYILKPINTERLAQTVRRIGQHRQLGTSIPLANNVVTIRCMQRLHIDYGKAEPFSWRTARSQELFAYLAYKRNQPVRKDILLELLWPDTDYKKAFTQLYTTIYQVRKSLESAELSIKLTNSGSDYYLDLADAAYDVQEWENAGLNMPELNSETAALYQKWLMDYTGDYLAEHDYRWAESERIRLRDLWIWHALEVGRVWREADCRKEALGLYEMIEKRFPYLEEAYLAMMQIHAENLDAQRVKGTYDRLFAMFREEYATLPSPETRQWYDRWMQR